jgi:hypothetical protein
MKYLWIPVIVLILLLCSSLKTWAQDSLRSMTIQPNLSVSDTLQQQLGQEVSNIMVTTDTIVAYHLEQGVIDTTDERSLESFKVIRRKLVVDSLATELKSLLTADNSYQFIEFSKRCEFLPHIGYVFHKSNKKLIILIDFDCRTMRVSLSGQKKTYDIDPANPFFIDLGHRIFSNAFVPYLNQR